MANHRSPSLEEVTTIFQAVDIAKIDDLINTIKLLLETKKDGQTTEKLKKWSSFFKTGDKILTFVNNHMAKIGQKIDLFQSDGEVCNVVKEILKQVGQIHPILTGLSIVGHLLTKMDQMLDNKGECLALLQDTVELANHIKNLRPLVREEKEKLRNAVILIVQGSMLCAKQLYAKKLFSFLKTSLDTKSLSELRAKINRLYPDLVLTAVIAMFQKQRGRLDISQATRPAGAVGIEEWERQVEDLLHMTTKDEPFRAVIIYGFGGIGKTTLASAVYAKLNLKGYNHTRVVLHTDPQKNVIRKKQEQILNDAFPNYKHGKEIRLRDEVEGKERLNKAFQEADKPVFLFIDNVLRAQDLRELLPDDLERLGKRMRLLLTTRDLIETNIFKKELCHEYLVKHLPNSDAIKILCNETNNLVHIKNDVERILKICGGVPLVLKIVCAHLEKQGYRADKCSQILNALERGDYIEEKCLSECMVNFVFKKFEKFTQEAFLDICCFFNGENRKRVEYAVGSVALKTLEDAALITIKLDTKYYAPMEENDEVVVVHDVIKAMGQHMAVSTRIKNIRSFEAAVRGKRLERIKGIQLFYDKDHSSYVINEEHLNSMSKSLRVFMLGRNISVSGTSNKTFPELRYVSLSRKIPCVPFHLEALQKLRAYVAPLLRQGVSIYKLPQSLRQISALESNVECRNWEQSKPMQVAPNSSLEELKIYYLSIKTLPQGLQSFTALKILKLDTWSEMEELPEVICGLHWLTTLRVRCCPLKYFPPSFGKLTSLTHLALNGCDRLEELPSTLLKLKALRHLNLMGCTSLKKLPSTFGELTALQGLNLRECSSLEEVPGLEGGLIGLKYLNVQYCPKLRRDIGNRRKDLQIVR